MTDTGGSRTVQCYHCRRHFDVPPRAMSISCPWCSKRVGLDDVYVTGTCWTSKIQTAGKVVVRRKGQLVAPLIEASEGIEVHGEIEGALVSNGLVWVGPKGRVRGSLRAPAIKIEPGGTLEGGYVQIKSEKRPKGAPRPPTGHAPVLRPESAIVRVMPWLKGVKFLKGGLRGMVAG